MNPSLLILNSRLNFNFESLPCTLLELSMKFYKVICQNCKKIPSYALLCLACGEKLCYTDNCCKNFGKSKKDYEFVYHNKICGNGDGAYVHLYSGEISFALQSQFSFDKISLYINKFGESVNGRAITEDYILNEDFKKTLLSEFKSLAYKKYFKVNENYSLTFGNDEGNEDILDNFL